MQPRLQDKKVAIIVCDRVGKEEDVTYVGMSCLFYMNPLDFLGGWWLGKREENLLVCDIKF